MMHDVIKMGELLHTFFTPDSHAVKRRRRRHLIDAATGKNQSARCRRRSKSPGALPPKE